ncbi:hypothetical protein [Paracoccus chinensis]|uniref:Uncharacterized protein n=1 Tax=Paracoccus chinensis TaxID=525640 RepID=A0A1G9MQ99_9RHOB|nr:hypothetical protein [Paracoccus chinensis]SDL76466.1 hypothetical protein SAMN04487971_1232 [Paracoccus chinensis]
MLSIPFHLLLAMGVFLAVALAGLVLWYEFGLSVALLNAFLLC